MELRGEFTHSLAHRTLSDDCGSPLRCYSCGHQVEITKFGQTHGTIQVPPLCWPGTLELEARL